jgi:hypothetical protein
MAHLDPEPLELAGQLVDVGLRELESTASASSSDASIQPSFLAGVEYRSGALALEQLDHLVL